MVKLWRIDYTRRVYSFYIVMCYNHIVIVVFISVKGFINVPTQQHRTAQDYAGDVISRKRHGCTTWPPEYGDNNIVIRFSAVTQLVYCRESTRPVVIRTVFLRFLLSRPSENSRFLDQCLQASALSAPIAIGHLKSRRAGVVASVYERSLIIIMVVVAVSNTYIQIT